MTADWVVTFTFDADPSMETMDAWETQLEGFDALVSRVPGHGIDVTVYAPGDWSVFDALAKMAGEVMPVVQAKSPIAVQIISEPEHRLRAEAFTTPELMSAAEIADELGVSRQRVHQLRSTAGFPAPLADLRGGAVWDAAAVRRFAETWERKPGRPHTGTAKFAYSWAVGPAVGRSGKAPNVRWRVENPDKIRFVLRNIGDDIAEDVEIDLSRIDAITRNVPKKTVIRPGEGLNMVLIAALGPSPSKSAIRPLGWTGRVGGRPVAPCSLVRKALHRSRSHGTPSQTPNAASTVSPGCGGAVNRLVGNQAWVSAIQCGWGGASSLPCGRFPLRWRARCSVGLASRVA
ncbi:Hypothetical protein ERS024267_03181 [Mycobacterium tuberculosis]|nr:Hypothetical protein ERS024267_03181 [Mycobacterium tuberculosis]